MVIVIIIWFILGFFSFGILGLNFFFMKRTSKKPWDLKTDEAYRPKISIIVPTYNEEQTVLLKLRNLGKVDYPKELTQIIVIDSNSTDSTVDLVKNYVGQNTNCNIELIVENERRGKSAALNWVLGRCKGDVIVVSDADCFWPHDILEKTLPFLSDPSIGAISGPKEILNTKSSLAAASEDSYLNSMNLIKLGESKIHSTILFEGGFSAYKKEILRSFDPYNTGSDDCGTVIDVVRQGNRAIMLPEGVFFTLFPNTLKEKIEMKVRRAGQLIKVLTTYTKLLIENEIKNTKLIVVKNVFVYLFSPIFFLSFVFCSIYLMFIYPLFILIVGAFLIPRLRAYLAEAILGYITLILAIVLCLIKRNFTIWKIPKDRTLLTENLLVQNGLL